MKKKKLIRITYKYNDGSSKYLENDIARKYDEILEEIIAGYFWGVCKSTIEDLRDIKWKEKKRRIKEK